MVEACGMCYNARLDTELTDDNDYSAVTVGHCANGFRIMACSGWGKPLRIEVEQWSEKAGWHKIGGYNPKHCPNCGREITEYNKQKFRLMEEKKMNKYTVRIILNALEIYAESEKDANDIATGIMYGNARTHLNHGFRIIDYKTELEEENVDEEETEV